MPTRSQCSRLGRHELVCISIKRVGHSRVNQQARSDPGPNQIRRETREANITVERPYQSSAYRMVHDIARVGFGEGTNELYDR